MLPNGSHLPNLSGRVNRTVVGLLTALALVAGVVGVVVWTPEPASNAVPPLYQTTIAARDSLAAGAPASTTALNEALTTHGSHTVRNIPTVPTTTLAAATTAPTATAAATSGPVTTTTPPTTAVGPIHMIVAEDTMIMDQRLVLRPGDSIEFRNGAQLMIHSGASVDWQGTPTSTWSGDGQTQNLERDIRIFGSGDIMFMEGSLPSIIRFVEIDLQPIQKIRHYPLHWHFVGEGSRGTLVEGVVVRNSTNRAFVPHASHGITFRDTIAKDIDGEGYWWDPPPAREDRSNDSNDIVFDHVLADGITNAIGDDRGFRLSAISLGAGVGNVIRNSVARNINPSHPLSCSGFQWPENAEGVWTFQNNATFGSDCHGIFVWQNTNRPHLIDGFMSTEGIEHGAYTNVYEYRNIQVPYVIAHGVGWSVTGGAIGEVRVFSHQFSGTITFSDVAVGSLRITNTSNGGDQPGYYVFNNTGLECADVAWEGWVAGTTVTIDGVPCPQP